MEAPSSGWCAGAPDGASHLASLTPMANGCVAGSTLIIGSHAPACKCGRFQGMLRAVEC